MTSRPCSQESCATKAASSSTVSMASTMAAQVGVQGSQGDLCSTGGQAGLSCSQQLQCSGFSQGSSGAALASAGVGFCASTQAST